MNLAWKTFKEFTISFFNETTDDDGDIYNEECEPEDANMWVVECKADPNTPSTTYPRHAYMQCYNLKTAEDLQKILTQYCAKTPATPNIMHAIQNLLDLTQKIPSFKDWSDNPNHKKIWNTIKQLHTAAKRAK